MRMRKKPNLIPRMECCADYLVTDPQQWRGRWREKGAPGCELRLELGCGKGGFLAAQAALACSALRSMPLLRKYSPISVETMMMLGK